MVWSRFDGQRGGDPFELLFGNAGIALAALAVGDLDLAEMAATPYLPRAESTVDGVAWQHRPGVVSSTQDCRSACDRMLERGDGAEFAAVLADDLAERATVDDVGVRWSNHEHRVTPSTLEPRSGWAMGSAGIIPELLRYARITTGRDQAYAVAWPDHPAATQ